MSGTRHTILIVDDERDLLESLRHLLRRDYRVLTAETGDEALAILDRDDVHVLLSDQRMPGMTGDMLLAHARERKPDTIRLLFTGYADIQAVIKAINEGGIYRYILKPWAPEELETVIAQAVAHYELLAERRRLVDQLQAANVRLTEANRDLAESDALKKTFLEVASHELFTPLTIIQGMGELLRLSDPDRPPGDRDLIDQLCASTVHLTRLIRTMLKLTRANDFRGLPRLEWLDLAAHIRSIVEQVRPFVQARRLRLDLDLADDLGDFALDADKMRDILLNLLTNAIKFTPDGGQIALSARLDGPDAVELAVADRGIGLEPRALEHLFEPFFTEFDAARHSSGEYGFNKRGLGLGLFLVKTFVEQHGGAVSVASAPNEGTRVTVRLPRRPAGADRAPVAPTADACRTE